MVGATAGLRLLPDGKADVILQEVRDWLRKHPFKVGPGPLQGVPQAWEGWAGWRCPCSRPPAVLRLPSSNRSLHTLSSPAGSHHRPKLCPCPAGCSLRTTT